MILVVSNICFWCINSYIKWRNTTLKCGFEIVKWYMFWDLVDILMSMLCFVYCMLVWVRLTVLGKRSLNNVSVTCLGCRSWQKMYWKDMINEYTYLLGILTLIFFISPSSIPRFLFTSLILLSFSIIVVVLCFRIDVSSPSLWDQRHAVYPSCGGCRRMISVGTREYLLEKWGRFSWLMEIRTQRICEVLRTRGRKIRLNIKDRLPSYP